MPFIVFEGIDGCGKSTQIKMLADFLNGKAVRYVLTREPGGTSLGEEIRKLLLRTDGEAPVARAELLLYEAARAQHVDRVIKPALSEKKWVISDRFAASTLAFQAHGRVLKPKDIKSLNAFATKNLKPELTILLNITVSESHARMGKRVESTGVKLDRFEMEKLDFHERVRKSYLQQAKADSKRWLVVDGTQSKEFINNQIIEAINKKKWIKK